MRTSFKSIVKSITSPLLAVVWCWSVAAQPSAVVNEQLRRQYVPTILFDPEGAVSLVSLEGTVFTIRTSGIKANPEFIAGYTPNYYSQGGSVTQPGSAGKRAPRTRVPTVEDLPVGMKVDITDIVVGDGSVTFNLQTRTELHPGTPQKHRAALTFQFQAGYVSPANLKQITDTIAEVLAVAEQPPPVPGIYIVQLQKDVGIAIQGNRLIVNGDEVWIQPNQCGSRSSKARCRQRLSRSDIIDYMCFEKGEQ